MIFLVFVLKNILQNENHGIICKNIYFTHILQTAFSHLVNKC